MITSSGTGRRLVLMLMTNNLSFPPEKPQRQSFRSSALSCGWHQQTLILQDQHDCIYLPNYPVILLHGTSEKCCQYFSFNIQILVCMPSMGNFTFLSSYPESKLCTGTNITLIHCVNLQLKQPDKSFLLLYFTTLKQIQYVSAERKIVLTVTDHALNSIF